MSDSKPRCAVCGGTRDVERRRIRTRKHASTYALLCPICYRNVMVLNYHKGAS